MHGTLVRSKKEKENRSGLTIETKAQNRFRIRNKAHKNSNCGHFKKMKLNTNLIEKYLSTPIGPFLCNGSLM